MSREAVRANVAIERLGERDVDAVVAVLAEAFADYPVMRFVLADDRAGLPTLIRMFVMARVLRGETLLGAFRGPELAAVAVVSYPDGLPPPAPFESLRADVWRRLGPEAEERYRAYGAATAAFPTDFPRVHLNMVGVRDACRGQGLGRRLIEAVQDLSRARAGSRGVTLTTEDPANVAYYVGLGFQEIGHRRVAPTLETWGFFRPG